VARKSSHGLLYLRAVELQCRLVLDMCFFFSKQVSQASGFQERVSNKVKLLKIRLEFMF